MAIETLWMSFGSIVAGLPDAAALLAPDLSVREVNAPFVAMSGLRRKALEAKLEARTRMAGYFTAEAGEETVRAEQALASGRLVRIDEVTLTNPNGDVFRVNLSVVPVLGPTGEVVALVQIFRDISAEAQMQRRYQELMRIERSRADEFERQVSERTYELRAALEEVTRLSRTDELTRIFNRRAFMSQAEMILKTAERHGRKVGLLVCDLDFFKKLNDGYGHAAGDTMLTHSAQALGSAIRETDILGRFGGEEFVVMLPDLNDSGILRVAQRCREAVEELPIQTLVPGRSDNQTVSIGAAVFPQHGKTLHELLAAADRALYAAKDLGRNRVEVFDPSMTQLSTVTAQTSPVVVVLDDDEQRGTALRELFGTTAEVVVARDRERMIELFRERNVDVVVADSDTGGGRGTELLAETVGLQPLTLRVMVLPREDFRAVVKATQSAQVNAFLLREDVPKSLIPCIDDALSRRSVKQKAALKSATKSVSAPQPEAEDVATTIRDVKLRLHYQPIMDARAGTAFAYEALCRPDRQMFREPNVLFDAAARTGQIWKLGRLIRRLACEDLERLDAPTLMFINLHPMELEDPQLVYSEKLVRRMTDRVVFEITERASINHFGRMLENVRDLKSLGVRFAVDDLGAGYASLNSLALIEPAFVKIDAEMIRDLRPGTRQARLVRRMVQLAEDAGAQVIAEGIETASELDAVLGVGVHLVQGYYLGTPSPPFAPLLRKGTDGEPETGS